jgi:regulator of protease activity HflC (stomatin/prohibitin superfamily)
VSKGLTTVLVLLAIGAIAAIVLFGFVMQRVEPGKVGVLIDYGKGTDDGKPSIESVAPGQFRFIGPLQRLAEYDMSQQSLTMVRAANEGQVKGDDSIVCRDRTGVQLNIDATIIWKIDTTKVGQLYLLYPDKDLNTLGQEVVRRLGKTALNDACGLYGYADIYSSKRVEFGLKVAELLSTRMGETYMMLASFNMGEVYLQPDQQTAVTAKSVAEQQAQEAAFLKQKRENEAQGAIAQAEGAKKVKILQAEAEAEAIRIINTELGNSPYYIKYIYASAWNGVLPATLVLSDGTEFPLLGALDLEKAGATPIPVPTKATDATPVTPSGK